MSIFDGIDMSDPCKVWPVLQRALDELLAGEGVASTKFGDDEVRFAQANISALQARIRELKAECNAKNGGGVRRHAIRAGWRRY